MENDVPWVNYFVCTLGKAARLPNKRRHSTIAELLRTQADNVPEYKAIGFAYPSKEHEKWDYTLLDFATVNDASRGAAYVLFDRIRVIAEPRKVIALLCSSTLEFLFNWLALVLLGHPVLLLAPQCSPHNIAHLCNETDAVLVLYDEIYEGLARSAAVILQQVHKVELHILPTERVNLAKFLEHTRQYDDLSCWNQTSVEEQTSDQLATAYFHHTSGTSSGVPKPIPQTQYAAVGALPVFEGSGNATFSTTPLYHGGIADLFRAWTSSACIWLFHEKAAPITASKILRSLEAAQSCAQAVEAAPVKYFSSVPYILQMLHADERGVEVLKRLDLVGVGGAALPVEVGDSLVNNGVKLVSRFGSAECGFLLTSHRVYEADRDWQHLRLTADETWLTFEAIGSNLSELVVLREWPHMAKRNRGDGSFSTADLFSAHEYLPNAWKYHSRADSQLTLTTGKKFDPAPMEAVITSLAGVQDAMIFGNGKPYPGCLVFRSPASSILSDSAFLATLSPTVDEINKDAENHAKLSLRMIVPMAASPSPLEKSSKGTLLRHQAEQKYGAHIDGAYSRPVANINLHSDVPDDEVLDVIMPVVKSIIGGKPGFDAWSDLFSFGADSIACIQIRSAVSDLLAKDVQALPFTVVEDCVTSECLARFIISRRHGEVAAANPNDSALMVDLVKKYGDFEGVQSGQVRQSALQRRPGKNTVLLTGATGALGAHILNQYLQDKQVSKIYCFVRDTSSDEGQNRIYNALLSRKLSVSQDWHSKIVVICGQLCKPDLGIPIALYSQLAEEVTIISHVAWAVNFRLNLRSFIEDHISGLRNLMELALLSRLDEPPLFLFCSSIASAGKYEAGSSVPEIIIEDPEAAAPSGYGRSKWVAEQICHRAHERTRLNSRIAIIRVGQLSGDTETGIWNDAEAWPIMLRSMKTTGCIPDLQNETIDWLPLNIAARIFAEIGTVKQEKTTPLVFHVLNSDQSVMWSDLLASLKKSRTFEVVAPGEWIKVVETLQSSDARHSAVKLLGLWKAAYDLRSSCEQGQGVERLTYNVEQTTKYIPSMRQLQVIDEAYFRRIMKWIDNLA